MKNIDDLVIDFFKSYGIYSNKDGVRSVINDITIDHNDLIDIFEEFLKKFDIKKGYKEFKIEKFFYKVSFFNKIRLSIFPKLKNKYKKKPPITITHMIEVAKRKEWFDPQ